MKVDCEVTTDRGKLTMDAVYHRPPSHTCKGTNLKGPPNQSRLWLCSKDRCIRLFQPRSQGLVPILSTQDREKTLGTRLRLFLYYLQFPGGWILVANFVMDTSTPPNNWSASSETSYHQGISN